MLHKPLGDDLRHELVGVVDALAAMVSAALANSYVNRLCLLLHRAFGPFHRLRDL